MDTKKFLEGARVHLGHGDPSEHDLFAILQHVLRLDRLRCEDKRLVVGMENIVINPGTSGVIHASHDIYHRVHHDHGNPHVHLSFQSTRNRSIASVCRDKKRVLF